MNRKLHYYLTLLISAFALNIGNSQINYSANFDIGSDSWQSSGFEQNAELPCDGTGALVGNLYAFSNYVSVISPSVGVSNGGELSLSYKYKVLDHRTGIAIANEQDWGFIKIYYAVTPTGPFRLLQTVDTTNHIVSEGCATKSVNFFAPQGGDVFIKIEAEIDNLLIDYDVYIDEIVVTQATPATCSGIPEASSIITSSTALCNGTNTILSLLPVYTTAGLNYQWQSSADGVTYTNISTEAASAIYTTSQTQSTWYRAVISCNQSAESYTTDPILVSNTGLDCLCDINFDYVEPITRVNFAGIDNISYPTVNATPGVENFTSVTPAEVIRGETYFIKLEGNTNDPDGNDFSNYFTVYIDWNQNGNLNDAGEIYTAGTISSSVGTDGIQAISQITVPQDALAGLTSMRVLKLYESYSDDACFGGIGETYGQAEDYLVNVSAPVCNLSPPTGAANQEFVNQNPDEIFMMAFSQVIIEADEDAILLWYLSAEDALNNNNAYTNDDFFTTAGIYYVTQTLNGCTSEPLAITISILLENKYYSLSNIEYYPNPVSNKFTIISNSYISSIEIFNLAGQKLQSTVVNSKNANIEMSSLPTGNYLIKILSEGYTKTVKLIKK